MGTGFSGTYVLTLDQTSLDGAATPVGQAPRIGQVWAWQGDAVRLDGPQSTILLGTALGHDALRAKVARAVRRRGRFGGDDMVPSDPDDAALRDGFVVSDGTQHFTLVPIEVRSASQALLWCPDGVPVAGRSYIVIRVPEEQGRVRRSSDFEGDVICFTAGSRIRTKGGHKLVETLQPGDHVQTRDNGSQEVLWVGSRRITGARLMAMPELRPVRIRGHAFDQDVPDGDLLVSPDHRMLYQGRNAQALFNTDEVLIAARDLVNDHSVIVDHAAREVTYIHLMLAEHQILWANGVPTESFHPANTSLNTIAAEQRAGLLELFPHIKRDLHSYGAFARRNLDKPEAAILLHEQT